MSSALCNLKVGNVLLCDFEWVGCYPNLNGWSLQQVNGSGVRHARSIHKEMVIFFGVNMNKIKRLT